MERIRRRLSGHNLTAVDMDYANHPPLADEDEWTASTSSTSLPGTVPSYESSQLHHRSISGPLHLNSRSTSITSLSTLMQDDGPTNASHDPSHKEERKSFRRLGLTSLNPRQHFALSMCRDISFLPPVVGLLRAWNRAFFYSPPNQSLIDQLSSSTSVEHFLTGIWCIVAGYLSYCILDGLMVRWIVTYSISAAIVRMLSFSALVISLEQLILTVLASPDNATHYLLHSWILISCIMTIAYVCESFVTSNLFKSSKKRYFDYYNITVFAVVPVGLASFATMIGILRSLIILRLDIETRRFQLQSE
ncbi:hypothetical protein BABINDRAFT_162067 [Babjeviella inositovora NRRL Y-12698]|uniref:N-glycosylation protein EOS1 n=1 Tax=Babjeviella inositovora NRRL Y-12698 TaxID=984486 RepID=A0A1E3QMX6_9ASCO|nr:uncharacterized protein BABINDRAFT_162067 [Babjeviella inositovora NRRL Y-12698]ODQ78988.1 hypothetical protein BABINDRAFT_162067 [Babjeviella inositovora NRRL Y-12698]